MREIKFRAWGHEFDRVSQKEVMYDVISVEYMMNGSLKRVGVLQEFNKIPTYLDDGAKLMQYTGLKDKNGVKIYEGDIVRDRYRKDTDWKPKSSDELEKVWWSDENLRWQLGEFMDLSEAANSHETTLEVIGNIYENPELLK